jgi:hypothetical protein
MKLTDQDKARLDMYTKVQSAIHVERESASTTFHLEGLKRARKGKIKKRCFKDTKSLVLSMTREGKTTAGNTVKERKKGRGNASMHHHAKLGFRAGPIERRI